MESELQEVCPEVELTSRQGLKNSLERMTAETLRVLCQAEGLSEVGAKKELVERLVGRVVSKAKGKGRVEGCSQDRDFWDERMSLESEDVVRDTVEKRTENEANTEVQNDSLSDSRYIVLEKSLEKTVQATLGKALEDFKRCVQSVYSVEDDRYWPKEKLNKPRDQFEYDEWCKLGRYLDNSLISKEWDFVVKARDVAATRAFMLRVANKEGWNVAAGIKDPANDDPMEAYFHEKLANARQSARNKRPRWESKTLSSGPAMTAMPIGFGNPVSNQALLWAQQPFQQFQQPFQSGLGPGGGPSYNNMTSAQGLCQRPYDDQGNSWGRSGSFSDNLRQYVPDKFPRRNRANVVCFICEERGHIAWDCPQKKSGQSFRKSGSGNEKS
ncbi:4009_t:CDS:1 [Cetraspora pellucida]|uniref:4009_t:CDS:1 n=1 Tax=Cetraspora pellucida TaxID=1433469 RepID=A0ACA9K0T7_9GLOM|nr:4009_t:CDS:1 [Cetraspora pellucida]